MDRKREAKLLLMQNGNCSSAPGNILCADDAGLQGTLTKFFRSQTCCKTMHRVAEQRRSCDRQHGSVLQSQQVLKNVDASFEGQVAQPTNRIINFALVRSDKVQMVSSFN